MTIFRSKPARMAFRFTNRSNRTLHILTEPWCEEFDLEPGDILQGTASVKELTDHVNPLDFELYLEDDRASLWCPPDSEFKIEKANSE